MTSDGFSFIEILIGLAIMAMLAAVVTPAVVTTLDRARVDATNETRTTLLAALIQFHTDVGQWPLSLSQLTNALVSGDANVCGQTYSNGRRNQWAGPYTVTSVSATGLTLPLGLLTQTLTRTPTTGTPTLLRMSVTNVSVTDATSLDREVDNNDGNANGAIRWDASATGITTMYWTTGISGC